MHTVGIHTVPVLIHNHLSRKHFLSHTLHGRTHTHSLMWGRICALRHTPLGLSSYCSTANNVKFVQAQQKSLGRMDKSDASYFLFPLLFFSCFPFFLSLFLSRFWQQRRKKESDLNTWEKTVREWETEKGNTSEMTRSMGSTFHICSSPPGETSFFFPNIIFECVCM